VGISCHRAGRCGAIELAGEGYTKGLGNDSSSKARTAAIESTGSRVGIQPNLELPRFHPGFLVPYLILSLLVPYILQEIQHVEIWNPITKLCGRERVLTHHLEGGDDTHLRASSVKPPRSSARILCKKVGIYFI
jgi:hypothetical protein